MVATSHEWTPWHSIPPRGEEERQGPKRGEQDCIAKTGTSTRGIEHEWGIMLLQGNVRDEEDNDSSRNVWGRLFCFLTFEDCQPFLSSGNNLVPRDENLGQRGNLRVRAKPKSAFLLLCRTE